MTPEPVGKDPVAPHAAREKPTPPPIPQQPPRTPKPPAPAAEPPDREPAFTPAGRP
ncbi:hypothetical protein ABIA38_001382 [Embleya sp. AB8]